MNDKDKTRERLIEELEVLRKQVAELKDIKIKYKQIEQQLKYHSLHDSLTGLYNRAYYEQEIDRLEGGRNYPIGIIYCDVDGLKLINDTLGFDNGDLLLKNAAFILKGVFRKEDMVARIGGSEFAILIPKCNKDTIVIVVQRIKNAIARYNSATPEIPLSMSIGFAVTDETSIRLDKILKEANNSMHREKLHHSQSARNAIVQALMKALEARDFITEGHAERLLELVTNLARSVSLPENKIADLRLLAQFHDIGKVGIPDRILFKPGPLTMEEVKEMQRHCEIGYNIAHSATDLVPIADLILKHHEWWNGKGYPLGLSGEEIPLECRILAIADAYDAMTNDRPYRNAMSHEEAVNEIRSCSGTQFDPKLVQKFVQLL